MSAKAAYSRAAQKKLNDSKTKLDIVRARLKNAVAAGRVESNERLVRAQYAVDANLAAAEARVERLRKSGEDGWEELKNDIDTAWEDLSRSINNLVARFSDGSS